MNRRSGVAERGHEHQGRPQQLVGPTSDVHAEQRDDAGEPDDQPHSSQARGVTSRSEEHQLPQFALAFPRRPVLPMQL